MEPSGTGHGLSFTYGSNMVNGTYMGPDTLGPTQQQDLLDGSQAPTQGLGYASGTPGVRKSCWLASFSACTASDLLHPSFASPFPWPLPLLPGLCGTEWYLRFCRATAGGNAPFLLFS